MTANFEILNPNRKQSFKALKDTHSNLSQFFNFHFLLSFGYIFRNLKNKNKNSFQKQFLWFLHFNLLFYLLIFQIHPIYPILQGFVTKRKYSPTQKTTLSRPKISNRHLHRPSFSISLFPISEIAQNPNVEFYAFQSKRV